MTNSDPHYAGLECKSEREITTGIERAVATGRVHSGRTVDRAAIETAVQKVGRIHHGGNFGEWHAVAQVVTRSGRFEAERTNQCIVAIVARSGHTFQAERIEALNVAEYCLMLGAGRQ